MSQGSICSQNCQDYCFIVLDICLALTTGQAKNTAIALVITLVRTSLRGGMDLKPTKLEHIFVAVITPPPPFLLCKYF